MISSADIGLAFYSPEIDNDRLTAFSSEKMAWYMQCGVPFIAFDYPGYRRLAQEDGCGAVIRTMSELPGAISQILARHETFRRNSFRAFSKYYDFDRNFACVIDGVEHL